MRDGGDEFQVKLAIIGRVLGFRDVYFRGYRDLGVDGYEVSEVIADRNDIMGAPGFGPVLRSHFEALLKARRP